MAGVNVVVTVGGANGSDDAPPKPLTEQEAMDQGAAILVNRAEALGAFLRGAVNDVRDEVIDVYGMKQSETDFAKQQAISKAAADVAAMATTGGFGEPSGVGGVVYVVPMWNRDP